MNDRRLDRGALVAIGGDPVTLNLGCGDDDRGVGLDRENDDADVTVDLDDGVPVADDAADRVIAEHVIEHLEDPSQAFREIRRVLHPEGEALVELPNAGWFPVRLYITQDIQRFWAHKIPGERGHWLARRLGDSDPDRTRHLTLWTQRLFREYLDRAGFAYDFEGSRHWQKDLRVTAWIPDDG